VKRKSKYPRVVLDWCGCQRVVQTDIKTFVWESKSSDALNADSWHETKPDEWPPLERRYAFALRALARHADADRNRRRRAARRKA
jgi:hypothetical protein